MPGSRTRESSGILKSYDLQRPQNFRADNAGCLRAANHPGLGACLERSEFVSGRQELGYETLESGSQRLKLS